MSVGSIHADKCNVVLSGVGPVDPVINEVQGQSIGPGDLILYNNTPVCTVHPDPSDVRVVAPVGPVQIPVGDKLC